MTIASGEQATAADVAPVIAAVAADYLKVSNDTERSTNETSYTKVKEIKINESFSGSMRIKFDMRVTNSSYQAIGKIYKNGVGIGTQRANGDTSYETYSEDLELSLVADDLLQIYAYCTNASYYATVRNFRFYYTNRITHLLTHELETVLDVVTTALSTTNQDP